MSAVYDMSFAGVPFFSDAATTFMAESPTPQGSRYRQDMNLGEHINRFFAWEWHHDYSPMTKPPNRNTASLARVVARNQKTGPFLRLGDWYYPHGAVRWGTVRGLMTGEQLNAARANMTYPASGTFRMQMSPSHGSPATGANDYVVSSVLSMLPARPLMQPTVGQPVYLVTLVDERFYWQWITATLRVRPSTTWADLITTLAEALGVAINLASPIESVWGAPEQDSELWCNEENAAFLLDAVAANVGRVVVREYNGGYTLLTPAESASRAAVSRGKLGPVVRQGGGDAYASGSREVSLRSILPSEIKVAFPRYTLSPPQYLEQRTGSDHFRQSYSDVWTTTVPLSSGGISGVTSGQACAPTLTNTAKAVYHTTSEAIASGSPANASGLEFLARSIAKFHWSELALTGLDECYPGTFAWTPDGLHDIVWAWSEMRKEVSCRVMRTTWNTYVHQYQHRTPAFVTASGTVSDIVPTPDICCPKQVVDVFLSGTITDYTPPVTPEGTVADVIRITGSAPVIIQSVVLESSQEITFLNSTSSKVVIEGVPSNDSSSSASVVRIPGEGKVVLDEGTSAVVWENPATGLAELVSSTGKVVEGVEFGSASVDIDDYPIDAATTTVSLNLTGDVPITGFLVTNNTPVIPGMLFTLSNVGTGTGVLVHDSTQSTGKIRTPSEGNLRLPPGTSINLIGNRDGTAWLAQVPLPIAGWTPTLSANQNDYPVAAGVGALMPTLTTAVTITGLSGLPVGIPFTIFNPSSNSDNLTLSHNSGSSSAANRFVFSDAASKTIEPGEGIIVLNDGSKIIDIGASVAFSGGGISGSGAAGNITKFAATPATIEASTIAEGATYAGTVAREWVTSVVWVVGSGGSLTAPDSANGFSLSSPTSSTMLANIHDSSGTIQATLTVRHVSGEARVELDGLGDPAKFFANGVEIGGGGTGTVTSVGLTVPSGLSVSGSPVTSSGTLAVTVTDAAAFRTAIGAGTGSGTVTSVGLTMPSGFTVTGSPVTSSSTLAVSITGSISMSNFSITDLGSPSDDNDAVPRIYVTDGFQPLDADLTAVAALSGTGIARRTGAGTWSVGTTVATAEIADAAVTYAKIQNVTADRLLGRFSLTGPPQEISLRSTLSLAAGPTLGVADASITDTQVSASAAIGWTKVSKTGSSLADLATRSAADLSSGTLPAARMPALTGDVTTSVGAVATTIANDAVTNAKLRNSGALSVVGRSANTLGDPADISAVAASGAVLRESGSTIGFGTVATAGIANDAVTYAKIQNVSATQRALGRNTAGSGDVEEVTLSQLLDWVGSATNGDILIRSAGTWTRLAIGTNGRRLRVASALPSYVIDSGRVANYSSVATSESTTSTTPVGLTTAQSFIVNPDESWTIQIEAEAACILDTTYASARLYIYDGTTNHEVSIATVPIATGAVQLRGSLFQTITSSTTYTLRFSVTGGTATFSARLIKASIIA